MSEIESLNSLQNILDTKLFHFIDSLKCDISMKLRCLANVLKVLKMKFKFSTCSKCHSFKEAGRHCQNKQCDKYMQNVKCPNCLRLFLKIGKHICKPDNQFVATTSKSMEEFDNFINNNSQLSHDYQDIFEDTYHLPFQEL